MEKDKTFNIKRMVIRPTSWEKIDLYFSGGTFTGTYEKLKSTCLEFSKQAFEKGEFKELLMGEKDYRIYGFQEPFSVDTETGCAYFEPTSVWDVMDYGICELYRQTKDEKIVTDFIAALDDMIKGEPYDVFTALQYLHCHSSQCENGKNPFTIDKSIFKDAGNVIKEIKWNWIIRQEIERVFKCIKQEIKIDME
jgi:hypothetical protein